MSFYTKKLIQRTLLNFSKASGIPTMDMTVSASGAFVMQGLFDSCTNLDIEVAPFTLTSLTKTFTKGYSADPFPMWHPLAGKTFRVYRFNDGFNVMLKTDPEENFGTTMELMGDNVFVYRNFESTVGLKTWLGRAKDMEHIAKATEIRKEKAKQALLQLQD